MSKVILRFYEELNDYLAPEKQKRDFEIYFDGSLTLEQTLEAQGVPQDRVDLVLVNGESVSFDHALRDGDRLSIYPVFERFDIGEVTNLEGRPLRTLRFVAEKGLVDLAGRLRALGFDVRCDLEAGAEEAAEIALNEHRILLTTRRGFLTSGKITRGLHIAAGPLDDQVQKIKESLDL